MMGEQNKVKSMTSREQITKLVRLTMHEGLRVFADRLVHAYEKN